MVHEDDDESVFFTYTRKQPLAGWLSTVMLSIFLVVEVQHMPRSQSFEMWRRRILSRELRKFLDLSDTFLMDKHIPAREYDLPRGASLLLSPMIVCNIESLAEIYHSCR